jgi:TonB family protein
VTVEAVLDAAGNVTEARIVSGPQELRRAAQESVLQWHFKGDVAGSTRVVNIAFQLPASDKPVQGGSTATTVMTPSGPVSVITAPRKGVRNPDEAAQAQIATPAPGTRTLKSITVMGLSDQVKSELLARLPVREGDTLSPESLAKVSQAVKEFDEHLRISTNLTATDATMTISTPETPAPADRIRIGGNVQQNKLINQPHPIYPPEAKAARIQGTVKLQATIAKDGTVANLEVISGHPLLVQAALDAVKQWVYQTTLLNGNPVEVVTQIDVNFTLTQ